MQGTIGEIRGFAGNFAPQYWAFCAGQELSINSFPSAYSILGTRFGGNGITTFGVPDFRGRSMIGPGQGPGLPFYTEGQKGGYYEIQLSIQNLPSHNHTVNPGYADTPSQNNPSGAFPANVGQSVYGSTKSGNMGEATVGNTGGNQAFNNMPPYTACYYIICLEGTYPTRP